MQIINRLDDLGFKADSLEDLKRQIEDYYLLYGSKPDVQILDDLVIVTVSDDIEKEKELIDEAAQLCNEGKFTQAMSVVEKAQAVNPCNSVIHRLKAQIYFHRDRDFDKAMSACIDALRFDPRDGYSLVLMGNILLSLKKYDDALKYYEKAVKYNPKDILAKSNIAAISMMQNDFNSAIHYYEELIESDNCDYATIYYGLVSSYRAVGQLLDAFQCGLKGIKNAIDRPENPGVREALRDLTVSVAHQIANGTNIQPIIDAIKEDLEEKLELPLEIISDGEMALAGKLEYGPAHSRGKHILYYNKRRDTVLHTILHELTHLEMNNAAARQGKNMILYYSEAQYEKFRNRYSDFIKNLKDNREIIRSQQIRSLFEGYNLCLVNTPLDLFVEWKIYNKYSTLQPLQFEALMKQNTININAFKGGIQESIFPKEILSNIKICNIVSAMLLRYLYGYDSIDEYQPTEYEKTIAKDLFDEFRSYVSARLYPGLEYSYVDYFISVCKAEDYVLKENEEDFVQAHKKSEYEKKTETANEEFRRQHKDGEDPALTMRMAGYMLSALKYFEGLFPEDIKRIAFDIATLGMKGIDPNKTGYKVDSIIGKEFGGYELLAYYYVSWAQAFPDQVAILKLPFSNAYALALQMYKGGK